MFADPTGRRALTMGGIGLTMAAATLAALVIVVTAAIGFTNVPSLPVSRLLGARPALGTAHRFDHHRFAALPHARRAATRQGVSDAIDDRRAHA